MSQNKERIERKPTVGISLFVFLGAAVIISYCLVFLGTGAHIPIALSTVFAAIVGVGILNKPWSAIEAGMVNSIANALSAIIIVMIIGMIIGNWIQSGVVPSLMYYGLQILSPSIFLLACLLICSIVSICTGSNWSTIATIGVALLGVAHGLGIPAPLASGFIISGAYLGDKMSPLSDTTNLAPACADSNIYDHIKAMCWSTGPAYLLVVIIAIVLGFRYASKDMDSGLVLCMMDMIKLEFNVGYYAFIPPVVVFILAFLKVPAIPGLFAGAAAGMVISLVQGNDIFSIIGAMSDGYETQVANLFNNTDPNAIAELALKYNMTASIETLQNVGAQVTRLLSRGGLISMMETVGLMICALAFGGVVEACGFLEVILAKIIDKIKHPGDLMLTTMVTCITCNVFFGDSYLAIALPGRMFRKTYASLGLAPMMLSRATEDFGTLTSVMIPWNTCGAVVSGSLGVSTIAYAPYCFLNYLNPIVSVILSYMKIGLYWGTKDAHIRAKEYPGDEVIKAMDSSFVERPKLAV